ncbi:MAG: cobalamin-dependent protein [Acidimicrobiia bacterium]
MTAAPGGSSRPARVLLAKTSLDGHWRGVMVVARILRDVGFEVVNVGMATADQIAAAARDEDVQLVGLNVGGRVEVVERVLDRVREVAGDVPVFAGGTVPPWAAKRLAERGVDVFPPGSSNEDIIATARRLVGAPST